MAICLCPNCGKKVSGHSMVCPFCKMPIRIHGSTDIQVERQSFKVRMIGIAASAVLTIIVFLVWRLVMYGLVGMLGESVQIGFIAASGLHILKSVFLVIISAVLFFIVPLIVKVNRTVLYVILTVVCCLLHFAVILPGTIPACIGSSRVEINMIAMVMNRNLIFVYGLAVPLFQGALSLMGGCCDLKKLLIWQGICAGAFEILSALFVWCGMRYSAHVAMVLGFSALAAAILIFGTALFMTARKSKTV